MRTWSALLRGLAQERGGDPVFVDQGRRVAGLEGFEAFSPGQEAIGAREEGDGRRALWIRQRPGLMRLPRLAG